MDEVAARGTNARLTAFMDGIAVNIFSAIIIYWIARVAHVVPSTEGRITLLLGSISLAVLSVFGLIATFIANGNFMQGGASNRIPDRPRNLLYGLCAVLFVASSMCAGVVSVAATLGL